MEETCYMKAVKLPPEDASFWGRVRSKWWAVKWWWEEHVWWHAPDWLRFLYRVLNRFYYEQVSSRIWPRQAWVTKAAGRTWCDKTELIPTILFAAIVHFIEEEDCFGTTVIDEPIASELRAVYAWAKTGRAAAYQAMDDSWHPGPLFKGPADPPATGSMEEYQRLEGVAVAQDTAYLVWIVTHRDYLWT